LKDTIDARNAMLCAIFNAAKKISGLGVSSMLDNLDYDECGLTRESFEKWWAEHQAEDVARLKAIQEKKEAEKRKATEAKKKTAAAIKLKSILSANLTVEERKILGV
jgi:hypothetical protein